MPGPSAGPSTRCWPDTLASPSAQLESAAGPTISGSSQIKPGNYNDNQIHDYQDKVTITGITEITGLSLPSARSLVANMVVGVTDGYAKAMEIRGVGYRVAAKGSNLEFALGYSHPVPVSAPDGITFSVQSPTKFVVSGIDKQKVGEVAANIRKLRKPDPYKGKGVRYEGEQIKLKVGKTGK